VVIKNRTMKEKTQNEIGKWLMDIAKYIATAILVTSFLGEFKEKWLIYSTATVLVGIFLFLGVKILNLKNQ